MDQTTLVRVAFGFFIRFLLHLARSDTEANASYPQRSGDHLKTAGVLMVAVLAYQTFWFLGGHPMLHTAADLTSLDIAAFGFELIKVLANVTGVAPAIFARLSPWPPEQGSGKQTKGCAEQQTTRAAAKLNSAERVA